MIVVICSVTLPFSHRVEIHFDSLEFPNSVVVPAIKSSAKNKFFFLALLVTLRQTLVYCMRSGHDHILPSFSPSRCVNIRRYTTQAAVSTIRCATHQ